MLFNSFIFVLIFLPLVIGGYFLLNHIKKFDTALVFLLGMCFWFYGFFNISYLCILILSLIFNYSVGVLIQNAKQERHRKCYLYAGIFANLGVLFVYKYFDFFVGNINVIFKSNFPQYNILLPLGISFFTFQQISYLVDISKGEVEGYYTGWKGFIQYAVYVSFFPQLVAGPIVLHSELMPQLIDETKKRIDYENLNTGLYIFVRGLAKKVLLADYFAKIADGGYMVIDELTAFSAFIVMISYTLQIYFDFGGYSDMAIGLARMINIELPVNFNSPYKALNINDFWKRWHITLTRFFRNYVYLPLGGNRKGLTRTCINIFIIFLLSGIWHGANWTFVVWGAMHGIAQVLYRLMYNHMKRIPNFISWLMTFLFVNLTWIMFRANSISDALLFYRRLFVWDGVEIHPIIIETFCGIPEIQIIGFLVPMIPISCWSIVLVCMGIFGALIMRNTIEKVQKIDGSIISTIMTVILGVWCICSFSGGSTFLYFNF